MIDLNLIVQIGVCNSALVPAISCALNKSNLPQIYYYKEQFDKSLKG